MKKWEKETSFSLKKIVLVKMHEELVICKSGYKINQNDFDGTKKALSKSKKKPN